MAHYIIDKETIAEIEAKKSTFICYLQNVASKSEAMAYVDKLKAEHPDARHHCWAFVIGDPAGSSLMGMTDDGEPHGTAGKPMLNILQHKQVGDLVAVVVRYWGGTKLGTGGLVRAYSGAVQAALDEAELLEKIEMSIIIFSVPFALEAATRKLLEDNGFGIQDVQYSHQVTVTIKIPVDKDGFIKDALIELSKGQVTFNK